MRTFYNAPDGSKVDVTGITPKERATIFKPYAVELGYVVYSWNRLHDRLSWLFKALVQSPSGTLAVNVWHSTDSDFSQRKMLRAAIESAEQLSNEQRKSILWMVNKIDESLRHDRNNALHAPLALTFAIDTRQIKMQANDFSASPRARALRGKDLIQEFRDSGDFATCLADYVGDITRALMTKDSARPSPWPEKPKLPRAHRTKSRGE